MGRQEDEISIAIGPKHFGRQHSSGGGFVAGVEEMALGIASTLRSRVAPNPLPIELWGYSPEDAAQLVKLVVDECVGAGIALREVRADPIIVHELTGSKSECGVFHREVAISADLDCLGRVHIYSEPSDIR